MLMMRRGAVKDRPTLLLEVNKVDWMEAWEYTRQNGSEYSFLRWEDVQPGGWRK